MSDKPTKPAIKFLQRSGELWQRVAWTELLVPETFNVFGDYWTREAIVDARDKIMMSNYGIDLEHDQIDSRNKEYALVEAFIARDDDKDFIPGSLVIGMKFLTDEAWDKVLNGEINGLSYEATIWEVPIEIEWEDEWIVTGVTEPDPFDGHTHTFSVVVGPENKVISGSTGETDGHTHSITTGSVTGRRAGHTHRYQIMGD